jgi:glycosyltransferase involved in cell wall biosynthesis
MTASGSASYRDAVPPLAAAFDRPKWSVMIPTFNCARFLGGTLESVLAQDPGRGSMQIEVVDDGSVDDPENVVRRLGGDRVGFFRQSRNVGHIANFQTCLTRARGEIVHLLHGDDLVRPGFYEALQQGFDGEPNAGAAFCRSVYIDADGQELSLTPQVQPDSGLLADPLVSIAMEQRIMTPSVAVRRAVYERLGGFDKRLKCSEDWEMWVRIAACFPVWYEPQPLALYRMHETSNTGRHVRSAQDMAYTRMAIEIFRAYLPAGVADEVTRSARRTYAASSLDNARRLLAAGDRAAFWAQVREAFRFEPSMHVAGRAAGLFLRHGGGLARRP